MACYDISEYQINLHSNLLFCGAMYSENLSGKTTKNM